MIRIKVPGAPPNANSRLGVHLAEGKAARHRETATSAWQAVAALCATTTMRGLGLTEPLSGPLLVLYFVRLTNGRRDWDSTAKDPGDALNGIVWTDDRVIVGGGMYVDNRADADELLIVVADPSKPGDVTAFFALQQSIASTLIEKKGAA
jgi:Holliday junction resolvase RusA-like endonuclease